MVWGNLATGYWLGGAAAAGLHWVELARKTLTGTTDTLNATAGWSTAANSGSVTVDGNITVTATGSSQIPSAWYDLGSAASTTGWVLRFKVVYDNATNSNSGQAEGFQVGLFDSTNFTGENPYSSVDGAFMKSGFHAADSSADHGLQTWDSNSTYNGAETGLSEPYSATRYFELKRDGTTMSLKVYSDEYSTQVGSTATDTITASNFTDLQYINVRIYRQGISATNTYVCSDMKFWNNTTSTSGTPTHEFNSTSGFTSGFTAKPYMMVLGHGINSGAVRHCLRLNGDTGSNYNWRNSANGGSTGSGETGNARIVIGNQSTSGQDDFSVSYIGSYATREPLVTSHVVKNTGTGAGNAPDRSEAVGRRNNTEAVTSVQLFNSESGDFSTGSEVVVLGCDPDDEEGTSAWEQLANVTLGSAGDEISSGTFTAKKYLWVQGYYTASGSTTFTSRFNDTTGNEYSARRSANGATDNTYTSSSYITIPDSTQDNGETVYFNAFIINKSDKEKLYIGEFVTNDAGTGAGSAPDRTEVVAKWDNTSTQITKIDINNTGTGDYASGGIAVWGFD